MKKSLLKIVLLWIIVTLILAFVQKKSENETEDPVMQITEEKEVSLNEWLTTYQEHKFEKARLEDSVNLLGYIFEGTGKDFSLLDFRKKTEIAKYTLLTTKKPLDTSLEELGFNLTGDTVLEVVYNEKGFFASLFQEFWSLILFFLLFFFGARLIMGKWGTGVGWLMNIQIGKKNPKENKKTKFSDIAGMEEVKNELEEIIDYLKDPEKYKKVWARPPKWVLLYGEPWSWKTLLARAVAWEANVEFFSASGSEFMEMLVGMGAAKVRTLFKQAKDAGKAIIFIDEIDAIWKKRGNGNTGWHQEQEQTLNQILTEMDGFETDTNIIVIAATNRPDTLDPALLRAWRFDRKIYVTIPTSEEREAIFKYYLKDKKISKEVNLASLIKRTSWLVGADIENIVNEASLRIAKDSREIIEPADFEYALEKVLMGPEKKVKKIQEKEKQITAYHELGHALLAHLQEEADPVEKISIVRRGRALWVTWTTPKEDKYHQTKKYLLEEVTVLLAWRASEEIFFGKEEITSGASNDFERANSIIRSMLVQYGMDEDLGLAVYKEDQDYTLFKPYSEEKAEQIDKKMKEYLDHAYQNAKDTIKEYQNVISKIAWILLKKEYLSGDEFSDMVDHPEHIEKYEEALENEHHEKSESLEEEHNEPETWNEK